MDDLERERRAAELFADALDLPPGGRDRFLAHECAGDEGLRAEVASLLAAYEPASVFFRASPRLPGSEAGPAADPAGTPFGPYRVLRLLAQGGMGEVYLAERTDEFRKQVAVKRIRPGLGTGEILERFCRERQLLADLEHPNIARLLDGGSTPDGLPYLVMEYVDGVPIDRWCDEQQLSVDQRLRLFLPVCDAVHYAHRHLVVHRDLKPSNILVDRDGQPKLLDFGIAKVLATDPTVGGAPPTLTFFRALTPRYASPEQIRGERITTSADVYSLGVVLYELLAGRSPYRSATSGALERAVCEEVPTRPSRVVRAAGGGTAAAISSARRSRRRLEGDLDTIVLRALAKDPARRYASAEDLAADLRRHLEGLPVTARPDTAAYRLSKFVQRNRALAAGVVGVIVLLAGALSITLDAHRRAAAGQREARFLAYTGSLAAAEASLGAQRRAEAADHLAAAPPELRGFEWRHLRARLDRSRRTLEAHRSGVTAIVFARDGTRFLTASLDSTIALWKAEGIAPLRRWGPLASAVESLSLDDAASRAAAGLSDGTVLVLPLGADGGPVRTLGRGFEWATVDLDRDGSRAAAGFLDGEVRVWDARDGREIAAWRAHPRFAVLRWDRSGDRLWTGGADGHLRAWEAGSFRLVIDVKAHERRIYAMAVSPDGARVATGSMDQTAAAWSTADGKRIAEFRGHSLTVGAVAFTPDGTRVVSGDADGATFVWRVPDGSVSGELVGHSADVTAVAVSPDGSSLLSGDWSGVVKVWPRGAQDVRTLAMPRVADRVLRALDVRLDPSGRRVAVATNSGSMVLLEVDGDGEPREIDSEAETRCVDWMPSGQCLLGDDLGTISVFEPQRRERIARIVAHAAALRAFVVDARRGRLYSAGEDSLVKAWTMPGLAEEGAIRLGAAPRSVALSADGARVLTVDDDGRVQWWDADSGDRLGEAPADSAAPTLARFAPDGRLVSAGPSTVLRVWRPGEDPSAAAPPTRLSRIVALAFSPDGARLAAAGLDGTVHLLEAPSFRWVATFHGHGSRVVALDFSADGRALASASWDGTVRIWDAPEP